jgi:hypothetical protein
MTYLLFHQPTNLLMYLTTYFLDLPPTTYLPTYQFIYLKFTYLLNYLFHSSHVPCSYKPTYYLLQPTYLPTSYLLRFSHLITFYFLQPTYLLPMDYKLFIYLPLYIPTIVQPTYSLPNFSSYLYIN